MKRFLYATLCLVTASILTPPAHADVGGQIPAPGLCDYPGVGNSGLDGIGVYHYWCDFPTEINGSHWHCELGGAALQAALNAGVSIGFLQVGGSIGGNVGVIGGSCTWRCPDMTLAGAPNPPGAWKDYLVPTRCKTAAPNPDIPPPPEEPPPPTPPAGITPAVTDPVNPNPDATVNPR